MKYLSVCSGIEAATCAWHSLGWQPFAFSEIEKFPSQVLAHHYPAVPNLGDMTKFEEWPDATIDLLVGGTPCQSFSVAGLRKGLADPRGNLMLTYGAIARRYRPKWLVWENVPGVLSSNGGDDFKAFLDMLESLGYVCDVEILDAQFFGVPQRRRRVFVCAQHRDDLLSQKTDTSALTIAQCLQEILLCILSEARSRFGSERGSSDLPSRSKDGAKRRMELFGLAGDADCWPMLLENLAAAFRRLPQEQRPLDATHGEPAKEPMPGAQSTDSQTASLFTLTEQSLKNALGDALEVMRLFITSTATSSTTQAQIFSCSRAALLIAQLTQRLSQSSPAFWNSALSSLTAVEEFTDYARSTSSDLFGDLERLQSWRDFIEQAERTNDFIADIGIECFGEVFSVSDSLQGHPAPSREAGKIASGTISSRTTGGGGLGTDFECSGGLQPVAHSLRGEGFDASEDGTGRGTPLVPVAYSIMPMNSGKDYKAREVEVAQPLMTSPVGGNQGGDFIVQPVLAFDTTQITSPENRANPKFGDPCHPLQAQAHVTAIAFPGRMSATQCASSEELSPSLCAVNPTAVAFNMHKSGSEASSLGVSEDRTDCLRAFEKSPFAVQPAAGMQVRRLTPEECEALQGFRRGYTLLQGHKADGPRYKALGNSMCVNVMSWIGKRIAAVDAINPGKTEIAA